MARGGGNRDCCSPGGCITDRDARVDVGIIVTVLLVVLLRLGSLQRLLFAFVPCGVGLLPLLEQVCLAILGFSSVGIWDTGVSYLELTLRVCGKSTGLACQHQASDRSLALLYSGVSSSTDKIISKKRGRTVKVLTSSL